MPVQKRVAGLVVQREKAVGDEQNVAVVVGLHREELQEKVDVYMGAADPL